MKEISFLKLLKKQNKLELVEPSEEIKESYLRDSESYLFSAKTLFNIKKLKETTQLTYFSAYYSVLALLFRVGIKSETHTASLILLKEFFGLDNSFISKLKIKRLETYYPDFEIEKQNLKELIQNTEEFNANIFDFISKLNQEKIKIYRNKFQDVLK